MTRDPGPTGDLPLDTLGHGDGIHLAPARWRSPLLVLNGVLAGISGVYLVTTSVAVTAIASGAAVVLTGLEVHGPRLRVPALMSRRRDLA